MPFVRGMMLEGFLMNLEEIQKFLDDNNITLEEYLRNNGITDEDRKYFDKIWVDAIYKNLDLNS